MAPIQMSDDAVLQEILDNVRMIAEIKAELVPLKGLPERVTKIESNQRWVSKISNVISGLVGAVIGGIAGRS